MEIYKTLVFKDDRVDNFGKYAHPMKSNQWGGSSIPLLMNKSATIYDIIQQFKGHDFKNIELIMVQLNDTQYNHTRTIDTFKDSIDIIKEAGFEPIAVSQMMLEDTFVFNTADEANKAYDCLENIKDSKVVGWWYGKEDFLKSVEEYEVEESNNKVFIHWLKNRYGI